MARYPHADRRGGKSEVATARPSLTTPQEAPTGRRRLPL